MVAREEGQCEVAEVVHEVVAEERLEVAEDLVIEVVEGEAEEVREEEEAVLARVEVEEEVEILISQDLEHSGDEVRSWIGWSHGAFFGSLSQAKLALKQKHISLSME